LEIVGFDLGSNSLRAVRVDCDSGKKIAEFEEIVRISENISSTSTVSTKSLKRVIDGINRAKRVLRVESESENCGINIEAVATEALRRVKNSKEVLESIRQETGIKFKVITAYEEALFTLKAVSSRLNALKIESLDFVLVDIGGGSTEIIFRFQEKILLKSFPIGIVTMADRYRNREIVDIDRELEFDMQPIREFVKSEFRSKLFVATAGVPTTIASIKLGMDHERYCPDRINGIKLEIEDLDRVLKLLMQMSEEERVRAVGVGREDLILIGVLIFNKLFKILNYKEVVVIDDGLREGIVLNGCKKYQYEIPSHNLFM
jgi:exopolyphosphatase/guanosine-5'-triphosphate,3'-diphosphate pyrophosphatase